MKKIIPVILTVLSCNAMAAATLTNVTIITGGNSGTKYNTSVHKTQPNKMMRHNVRDHDEIIYDDGFGNRHMKHAKQKHSADVKHDSDWYIAARAELAFWNFKKTLSLEPAREPSDTESYSFKPVFGGNLSVGKWFNNNWRGDIELGYLGYYSQEEDASKFAVQAPYAMLNGYYNFDNGLYLGAGVGVAMPIVTTEAYQVSLENDANKIGFGFMAGAMLGYSTALTDSLSLDLRYRLAGLSGTTGERGFIGVDGDGNDVHYTLKNKVGFVLSNSISLGLRFNF